MKIIIRHLPTNESSMISSSEQSTCCGELPVLVRLMIAACELCIDGMAADDDNDDADDDDDCDAAIFRIWLKFISELVVLLGKLSLDFVGGRFFFIWSWKLIGSLGKGDDDDAVPTFVFAFVMQFLLEPLNCVVMAADIRFFDDEFIDPCNGDLFDSNEENALFPLLFEGNQI